MSPSKSDSESELSKRLNFVLRSSLTPLSSALLMPEAGWRGTVVSWRGMVMRLLLPPPASACWRGSGCDCRGSPCGGLFGGLAGDPGTGVETYKQKGKNISDQRWSFTGVEANVRNLE